MIEAIIVIGLVLVLICGGGAFAAGLRLIWLICRLLVLIVRTVAFVLVPGPTYRPVVKRLPAPRPAVAPTPLLSLPAPGPSVLHRLENQARRAGLDPNNPRVRAALERSAENGTAQ